MPATRPTLLLLCSVALAALAAAGACSSSPDSASPARDRSASPSASTAAPRFVTSNLTRADYAGSAACARCHAGVASHWDHAPMHRMTRTATPSAIRAPLDERNVFEFKDDTAHLAKRDGKAILALTAAGTPPVHYELTRVIGGRVREDFAGVRLDPSGARVAGAPEEILPLTHMLGTGELRYKGYSVMSEERPGLRAGPSWSKACIFCHNTVPELDRLLAALAPASADSYQGAHVDARLPRERQRPVEVIDPAALRAALEAEIHTISPERGRLAAAADGGASRAISVLRDHFDGSDLVEQGIGCEACHLGSREHVADPTVRPSFAPRSPFLAVSYGPDSTEAEVRACAACHQVLFSQYPHTWEAGARDASAGGSSINSGEARDLLLGGCSGALRCSHCHDLHPSGAQAGTTNGAASVRRDDAVCTGCHRELAAAPAAARHSGHAASSEGARCIACHMPRKNASLGTTLTAYHRVGSPTDPERLYGDRPIECVLCHADWTVARAATAIESRHGPVDRGRLRALYGDLDRRVLDATLADGKPHEQLVAIFVAGDKRDRAALPAVADAMTHRIPLLRYYARDALEKITGSKMTGVDLHTDRAEIRVQVERWRKGTTAKP